MNRKVLNSELNAHDFVIKIIGCEEYILYDDSKMIVDYEAVRRAVRNSDDVQFGLVHRPDFEAETLATKVIFDVPFLFPFFCWFFLLNLLRNCVKKKLCFFAQFRNQKQFFFCFFDFFSDCIQACKTKTKAKIKIKIKNG